MKPPHTTFHRNNSRRGDSRPVEEDATTTPATTVGVTAKVAAGKTIMLVVESIKNAGTSIYIA
jgi:hypothetical protein